MIRVEGLHLRAGSFSLKDVSFEVATGSYAVLMGRTGTGKTTLLETIAGLKSATAGRIFLGKHEVTHLKPAARNIGYVPQDGALFNHMSVEEQLGFALTIRHLPPAEIRQRVGQLAEMLEIEHLLKRSTKGLSGGERQRVSLGRALAFGPSTLCLDEPLSALDEETREQIVKLLKRVQHETRVTCLHVTHNRREAIALADVGLELIETGIRRTEYNGTAEQADPS